ncbi:IS1380 family transposase [Sporolactobacillus nakayamae]|uniref:Transposase DDE domain group 1 n=1 Tax=Sporolactobacillus nakayamae TaxID=269670 RepID=A0A1I2PD55_9BACL|nr:IS1380 family transposase [Sporolactobacillus nakayamae]SFG14048.1 Transposase DDE domain group 1 [Sporolactobacillus nakayamae]
MISVKETSLQFNKKIKISFSGGALSSDSGLLLYREFDGKMGLSQLIHEQLNINDSVSHTRHTNADAVIQKIYQHLAGYHTDDQADELGTEPVFTTLLGKDRLASQPTLSRVNQKVDEQTVESLKSINQAYLDGLFSLRHGQQMVLDVDSANFETAGKQEGSAYNAHYQDNGFHPLFLFDSLTGACLKADLRSGNVYTSRGVVDFIRPVLEHYRSLVPGQDLALRGDSGFAVPGLYTLCEEKDVFYAIRLKANHRLNEKAQNLAEKLQEKKHCPVGTSVVFYTEFSYQAASWATSRRVVVKLERPEGELFFQPTFIVTNMSLPAKRVVKFYQNRGTMENLIKEGKQGFAFDQLSSTRFEANATKLQIRVLANNFQVGFHLLCLPKTMKKKVLRMDTVRLRLVKIAGRLIHSGRYLIFRLCSHCLYQKEFWQILEQIRQLPARV